MSRRFARVYETPSAAMQARRTASIVSIPA